MKDFGQEALKLSMQVCNESLDFVALEIRSDKFYVRGTFPPKQDETKQKQRSLSLKLEASKSNLSDAHRKAISIDLELHDGTFSWEKYDRAFKLRKQALVDKKKLDILYRDLEKNEKEFYSCSEWIHRLEEHHWSNRPKTETKLNTWRKNYLCYYQLLPQESRLDYDLLKRVIEAHSNPTTRKRQLMSSAYEKLLVFIDPISKGRIAPLGYGYKKSGFDLKTLPSDEKILKNIDQIEGPWRNFYCLMAAYGIRPSELRCLDLSLIEEHPHILLITNGGKTRAREVYPCPANWPKDFGIADRNLELPNPAGKCNNDINPAVSKKFRKLNLGHIPTKLRDAYAIRLSLFGIPIEFAARWCGHSVEIHEKNYLDSINRRHNLQIFNRMANQS